MLRDLLHTALPDVVIHLDLDVDEAVRRVGERGRSAELHETTAQLRAVRGEYDTVLGWLATRPAPVRVHRIDCGVGRSVDEIAAEAAERLNSRMLDPVPCT